MKRIVKFHDYRNLGVGEDEEFVLNRSMQKGNEGGLAIIIGPNNSGKSNVIDGLRALGTVEISNNDITNFLPSKDHRYAEVNLIYLDGDNYYNVSVSKSRNSNSQTLQFSGGDVMSMRTFLEADLDSLKTEAETILGCFKISEEGYSSILFDGKTSNEDLFNAIKPFFSIYKNGGNSTVIGRNSYNYSVRAEIKDMVKAKAIFSKSVLYTYYEKVCSGEEAKTEFQKKYGFAIKPDIVSYNDKPFSSSDLHCNPSSLSRMPFFTSLFGLIGVDTNEVSVAYELCRESGSTSFIKSLERKINAKIKKNISNRFNKLYSTGSQSYMFELDIETNDICFNIYKKGNGEEPVPLNYAQQSTGFKWFFDFYFRVCAASILKPGDILLLDEPATNLHPHGQSELKEFITDFARRNGITVVISTHSPFYINPDSYEELRVVEPGDLGSHINNTFTVLDDNDADALRPIKDALTVETNILYDNEHIVVWVEGFTDYAYLTAFKKVLDEDKLYFLPFNGLGRKGDKERLRKLIVQFGNYHFHKSRVLVDGDEAGRKFQESAEDTALSSSVLTLRDIFDKDESIKEIEDLFAKEDRGNIPSANSEDEAYKRIWAATLFKERLEKGQLKLSQDTLDHFKTLFAQLKQG